MSIFGVEYDNVSGSSLDDFLAVFKLHTWGQTGNTRTRLFDIDTTNISSIKIKMSGSTNVYPLTYYTNAWNNLTANTEVTIDVSSVNNISFGFTNSSGTSEVTYYINSIEFS